ncbi:MAG: hypothetical protein GX811_03825, partial [Lentisphaerae bacterium]|nr:hypothetical protein [Lentisphaerota bacterium]
MKRIYTMTHDDYTHLLETAIAAAEAAGNHAKNNRTRKNQIAQLFAHDINLQLD